MERDIWNLEEFRKENQASVWVKKAINLRKIAGAEGIKELKDEARFCEEMAFALRVYPRTDHFRETVEHFSPYAKNICSNINDEIYHELRNKKTPENEIQELREILAKNKSNYEDFINVPNDLNELKKNKTIRDYLQDMNYGC